MKMLLALIIGFCQFSCLIRDPKTDIKEILEEKNYTIEWAFQGCFGGATQRIAITNSTIAIITWVYPEGPNKPEDKAIQVPWNSAKEQSLKEFFESGIELKDGPGICTESSQFILKGFVRSVGFVDLDCRVKDKLESLLH